eukprot:2098646-Rhodomonas_salina.4
MRVSLLAMRGADVAWMSDAGVRAHGVRAQSERGRGCGGPGSCREEHGVMGPGAQPGETVGRKPVECAFRAERRSEGGEFKAREDEDRAAGADPTRSAGRRCDADEARRPPPDAGGGGEVRGGGGGCGHR